MIYDDDWPTRGYLIGQITGHLRDQTRGHLRGVSFNKSSKCKVMHQNEHCTFTPLVAEVSIVDAPIPLRHVGKVVAPALVAVTVTLVGPILSKVAASGEGEGEG
jgi:hypothetical protein